MIIAIDGPAGAGKSTVARAIARELGLAFLDTGAMYRAITLVVLERGAHPSDEAACTEVARSVHLAFDQEGCILIDGRAGEPGIRSPTVTLNVSAVSAHPGVRAAIVEEQRAIADRRGGVVAEGRDTTTVVFPQAEHKFFLAASVTERARRRALQDGTLERLEEIQEDIERRDRLDTTRAHSPLIRAPGAVVIDADGHSADEVVATILDVVRGAREPMSDASDGPRELITWSTPAYRFGRFLTWSELKLVHRLRVEGKEHLPRDEGYLIVSNHQSFLDIPVVAAALMERHVCFVARESLARSRFLAWLMRRSGAVLIQRGAADRQALGDMVEHLKARDVVCVFPEGTRSVDGSLGEFLPGALFAAKRARVQLVPAGITGALEALPRDARLPRFRRIGIRFGPPIDGSRRDAMEVARERIAEMIGDGGFGNMPSS